jgi:hypothetical protein
MDKTSDKPFRVALLWRGDPAAPAPDPAATRFHLLFEAFAELGVAAEPVVYADEAADAVRERLKACDGVLVWVDPLSDGKTRARLDPLLRDVAAGGVWVSSHPDVILKMGVKAVLYRTRQLGWGADTHLYRTADAFRAAFPERLAQAGPRVLKQNRGNGGQGVWKVELAPGETAGPAAKVRALHALRGSTVEVLTISEFMRRYEAYFAGDDGLIIDQAFQPRLPEGMIRCYMAGGEVAGYGHQLIKALVDPPAGAEPEAPGPRIMHPPQAPAFQALRELMERDWIPGLQRLLAIDDADLPALWDADFLYGPKTAAGDDTYVLCEINVSAVAPYPDSAASRVAGVALERMLAARAARGGR